MALISVCKAPCKLTALQSRVSYFIRERDRETTLRIIKIVTIKAAPSVRKETDMGVGVAGIKGTENKEMQEGRELFKTDSPPSNKPENYPAPFLTPCLPCLEVFVWILWVGLGLAFLLLFFTVSAAN